MKHEVCLSFVCFLMLIRDSDCVASKLTDDLSTLTAISVAELPARRAC
jgi:hypothetical protein